MKYNQNSNSGFFFDTSKKSITGKHFVINESDWDNLEENTQVVWDTNEYEIIGYQINSSGQAILSFRKIEGVKN